MKKVIAILAIAIVLIGAVFAAGEDHTLTVTASVTPVEPAFRLGIANSGTTAAQVTNNSTPTVVNLTNGSYTGSFTASLKLNEGGSFVVIPQLVNNAKTTSVYVLTFTGGTFNVKKKNVDGTVSPSSVTTAENNVVTGIGSIVADDANEKLTVTFDGKTATASTGTPVVLGTVTYTYTADDDVDLGNWTTDIVMTITSGS